jgi:hypothetical protein
VVTIATIMAGVASIIDHSLPLKPKALVMFLHPHVSLHNLGPLRMVTAAAPYRAPWPQTPSPPNANRTQCRNKLPCSGRSIP